MPTAAGMGLSAAAPGRYALRCELRAAAAVTAATAIRPATSAQSRALMPELAAWVPVPAPGACGVGLAGTGPVNGGRMKSVKLWT